MTDSSNDNNNITDITPEIDDNSLPEPLNREDELIRCLFICDTEYEAGIMAGYSENYSKTGLYAKTKRPEFRRKLLDYAVQNDLLDLPTIARIERKILKLVDKDVTQYDKYKAVFKQKKQTTGLLDQDGSKAPVTMISLTAIRELHANLGDQFKKDDE